LFCGHTFPPILSSQHGGKGREWAHREGEGKVEKVGWDFFTKEMGRGTRGDVTEGCGLKKREKLSTKNTKLAPFCPF
jgi:hypothetical protein